MAEHRVEIGTVTGVNPARRELRIKPARGRSADYENLAWVQAIPRDGEPPLRCRVARSRTSGETALVALAPGVPRDTVAKMKGWTLAVLETERKSHGEEDFDVSDLLNFDVIDGAGVLLGSIVSTYETKANAVLEVEKTDGGIVQLPVIEQVIARVDWKAGRVEVGNIVPYAIEDRSAGRPRNKR